MTLEIKKKTNETTIKVVGRLDSFTAPVLGKMIVKNALSADVIVLELSGVDAVSEAGLQVLLDTHKKVQPVCSLRLVGIVNNVMETFKLNGCDSVLAIS